MKNKYIMLVFLVGLLLNACTPSTQPASVEDIPVQNNEVAETSESSNTRETIQEITITANNWKFDPATIQVKQGTRVKLEIKSIDVDHGFKVRDYNIDVKLTPGKTETVEFVADKAGTFEFFCSVFCGSGHKSMRGTLIVE